MPGTLSLQKSEPQIAPLLDLAIRGLRPMYVAEEGLFCHRLVRASSGLVRQGVSHRYTLITLLGLLRAESAGLPSPVKTRRVIDFLLSDSAWINNLGDLGLLLWVCALSGEERLARLCRLTDLGSALARYPAARERRTMELAWFLSGLSHAGEVSRARTAGLAHVAATTYDLLQSNQGHSGIFAHAGERRSLAGIVRGRIGSFADQVYPIYALSMFARTYGSAPALQAAVRCAMAICNLQGSLGQWWWHYDSVTGRVAGRYPVYSVHQEGMAPMALFAVTEAAKQDFRNAAYAGVTWITGTNELSCDMREFSRNIIWRSVHQPRYKAYANEILAFLEMPGFGGGLKVKHECRPYELGWLLYAFASFCPLA